MSKRYIQKVVISDPSRTKIILDNGDVLEGVFWLDLDEPVEPFGLTSILLKAYIHE